MGPPQGHELRPQGVVLLMKMIGTFVCLVAPPLPRCSRRVVQEVSEVILEALTSLEEVLVATEQRQGEVLTIRPTGITSARVAYEGKIGVSTPGTSGWVTTPMRA